MAVDIPALLAELTGIVGDYRSAKASAAATDDNFRCEGCDACHGCRFCNGCRLCDECTYCEACVSCTKCTRCKACEACNDSNQLEHCRGCERSQHLLLCLDCSESSHCIACVGLVGEEYCILNHRYSRKDFFRVSKALKKHLEGSTIGALFDASVETGETGETNETHETNETNETSLRIAAASEGGERSRFFVDGLRRIRGRVASPGAGAAATAATAGTNTDTTDSADDDPQDPWQESARAKVDRVADSPDVHPPAYGVITWDSSDEPIADASDPA